MQRLLTVPVIAALLFAALNTPATAGKKLCPDGYYYYCTGGINGVNCRCL